MDKRILIVLLFVFLTVIGCSYKYGSFSMVTTKDFQLDNQEFQKVEEGVTGKSVRSVIVFIPTGQPEINEAIEDALNKVDGDIICNAELYYKWFWIPYIYGEYKFEIKGDVWKIKNKKEKNNIVK